MQNKPYNYLNHATKEENEILGTILHTDSPATKLTVRCTENYCATESYYNARINEY
jgi:hypothetical protein